MDAKGFRASRNGRTALLSRHGVSADGRRVTLQILPSHGADRDLNADRILDHSGSMNDPAVGETVLDATWGALRKHDDMINAPGTARTPPARSDPVARHDVREP